MKNKCSVAKDLMPLCIDGVASEESQQYVDEHIAECTECAVAYGEMRVELPRINAEKEKAAMEKAAKKVRHKRILRGVVGALAGILIFLACRWGVSEIEAWQEEKRFLEKYVCENGDIKLEALCYNVSQEPGDLRVQANVWGVGGLDLKFGLKSKGISVNDGTGICVQYHAVYADEEDDRAVVGMISIPGRVENGVWVQYAEDLRDENGKLISLPVVRMELHAGDDYVVLWEEGDVVQTPEEAEEERIQQMKERWVE